MIWTVAGVTEHEYIRGGPVLGEFAPCAGYAPYHSWHLEPRRWAIRPRQALCEIRWALSVLSTERRRHRRMQRREHQTENTRLD
jgi:hypothetical protein